MTVKILREQISQLVSQFAELSLANKPFVAGSSVVPPSGKVIGAREMQLMVEASLDGWLTTGRFNAAFEKIHTNTSAANKNRYEWFLPRLDTKYDPWKLMGKYGINVNIGDTID